MTRTYQLRRPPGGVRHIDFAAELNEQQLAAVTAPPGKQLVIAGAGSGKTRTLTYRVAYLLENGIAADNILLLTFTNKAAREMLERVKSLLPMDIGALWGGTFHSIGNRILRRHADRMGFTRGFSIMDREDQKDLIASAIAAAGVDTKSMRFPKPEVIGTIISLSVNTGEAIEKILMARYDYFAHHAEAIAEVRRRYEEKKRETNTMDFDDLLVLPLRLLKDEDDLRERYQRQFQFILVDEYQDTNWLQGELIDMLAGQHGNVMVVGDDAQSVYSWRGANFENILEFPKRHPGAEVFRIETNYRSVPEVLELANAAILANQRQFRKTLRPHRPARGLLPALVKLGDANEQAAFVAQRILELRDEGIELEEIAILYRAHFHSMEIQMELTARGIPFQITSGLRFFEQAHIKDAAAFMKFAVNRLDEVAFRRIVRLLPGIGAVSADKLWTAWRGCPGASGADPPATFSEHMLGMKPPAKAKELWAQLAYTLDELVAGGKLQPPAVMLKSIIEGVYEDYLRSKYPNFETRRQDLDQLFTYSERFQDTPAFLAELALLSGIEGEPSGRAAQRDPEAVTLSTVHQAKGLEWRAVFLVWLAEGMFPSSRTLESGDPDSLEEERRLFYVAVTRAKDELYLLTPMRSHSAYAGETMQRPSQFLSDFPADLAEEWKIGSAFY